MPCEDYHCLHVVTTNDRFPLSHITDFNGKLARMTIFSGVDLVRGFHQIPMAKEDVPKMAIITRLAFFNSSDKCWG